MTVDEGRKATLRGRLVEAVRLIFVAVFGNHTTPSGVKLKTYYVPGIGALGVIAPVGPALESPGGVVEQVSSE